MRKITESMSDIIAATRADTDILPMLARAIREAVAADDWRAVWTVAEAAVGVRPWSATELAAHYAAEELKASTDRAMLT